MTKPSTRRSASSSSATSRFTPEEGRAAEKGDRVTIDFVGKIDGEAFEGGTAEARAVVIGQGNFIPGFEDGLKGAKAGDERDGRSPRSRPTIRSPTLAGKDADVRRQGEGGRRRR